MPEICSQSTEKNHVSPSFPKSLQREIVVQGSLLGNSKLVDVKTKGLPVRHSQSPLLGPSIIFGMFNIRI